MPFKLTSFMGTVDPTVPPGFPAPAPSVYYRVDALGPTPTVLNKYDKVGQADTDRVIDASCGATGG